MKESSGFLFSDKPLLIFDLETTGKYPNTCRIIQIAMKKIMPDGEVIIKDKLINPEMEIPYDATKVHGITNEMVSNAVTFKEISKSLIKFIGDSVLIGYNIYQFDLPLLRNEFYNYNIDFNYHDNDIIDVYLFEKKLLSEKAGVNQSLALNETYNRYCGEYFENAHNAFSDVIATEKVLFEQLISQKYAGYYVEDVLGDIIPKRESKVYIKEQKNMILKLDDNIHYWNFGMHKTKPLTLTKDYCNWFVNNPSMPRKLKKIVKKYL